MTIIYGIGLAMALLIGGAIGLLVMAAYYEQIALQQREYEREVAERRHLYATLITLHHVKSIRPTKIKTSAR